MTAEVEADEGSEQPLLLLLTEVERMRAEEVGAKAANLGILIRHGFSVPAGFVLTTRALDEFLATNILGLEITPGRIRQARVPDDVATQIRRALASLGGGPVAVRSSGVEEDLPGASFAGQYETILGVLGADATIEAVKQCWASAFAPRAAEYRLSLGVSKSVRMAVIIQKIVDANAAGVAFTSNPLTGDSHEVVINAVRGLGDRLVSGEASADQWTIRDGHAECVRAKENAITQEQATAIAETARRVEDVFAAPQDIEWAISGGRLFLLQARPITALPGLVKWDPPVPGAWVRNFRLGEWLGDPVTPLFETWFLEKLEDTLFERLDRWMLGAQTPKPYHVTVNGWYFASVNFLPSGRPKLAWMLLRYLMPAFIRHPRRMAMLVPSLSSWGMEVYEREWRDSIGPKYSTLVQTGESRVETAGPEELLTLIDGIAEAAGAFLYVMFAVAGSAWKPEYVLASFYNKHLLPQIGGSHQRLLQAVGPIAPLPQGYSVSSLDWYHPTLGELQVRGDEAVVDRREKAIEDRNKAESEARATLKESSRLLRKFEHLLAAAQRAAVLREEQAPQLTLGWPLARSALLRLGDCLQERGVIENEVDVFFLTHVELLSALKQPENASDLRLSLQKRRSMWLKQRRLSVPLQIGGMSKMAYNMVGRFESAMGARPQNKEGTMSGIPASPGRATGKVRVVRAAEEFEKLLPGEVLVAPATTPAWTSLFNRAVAIVTDTGSLMAHASLVAREYGIPAVVGTGDATRRLHDGQLVTVNGTTGLIEPVTHGRTGSDSVTCVGKPEP